MERWHLSITGNPARCRASKKPCPRGGDDRHFDSPEAAQEWFESTMVGSLIATVKKHAPRFKKTVRVGASITLAMASLAGVSNIASASEVQPTGWVDKLDEIVSDSGVDKYLDDFGSAIDDAAGKTADWLNQDSVKNSRLNRKVDSIVDNAPGYSQFQHFFNTVFGASQGANNSQVTATMADDGSILWQGENLTPTEAELSEARSMLESLPVMAESKASKYDREKMFGSSSESTRSFIEVRDLPDATFSDRGRAVSGTLRDPYTGEEVYFQDSERPYDLEHLVALKEAYRSEDPNNPLTLEERSAIANDPDNLLLVTAAANRSKSDKDAKDWLPSYEASHARFAISTIKVKAKYGLTVDKGEYEALSQILRESGY